MISYVSEKIADCFINNHGVEVERRAIIKYGVEITLSTAIGIILVLALGLISHQFVPCLLFLAVINLVKQKTGGYHAKSHFTCSAFTVLICAVDIAIYETLTYVPFQLWFLIGVISILVIAFLAPCENPNHPLSSNRKKRLKKQSIFVSILTLIAAYVLFLLSIRLYQFVIIALTTICINLVAGIIEGGRKSYE